MSPTSGRAAATPITPATALLGLVAGFCAVLLVKWIAILALVALVAHLALRAVRARLRARVGGAGVERPTATDRVSGSGPADCGWCGHPGGHRDPLGRPLRPREVHVL